TGRIAPLAAAGVASGATALVRIDGAAFAVGAAVGVILALTLADAPVGRRARGAAAFLGMQALFVASGYLSLRRWSEEYLERLGSEAQLLVGAYAVVVLLGGLIVLGWRGAARLDERVRALSARAGHRGALVLAVAVAG